MISTEQPMYYAKGSVSRFIIEQVWMSLKMTLAFGGAIVFCLKEKSSHVILIGAIVWIALTLIMFKRIFDARRNFYLHKSRYIILSSRRVRCWNSSWGREMDSPIEQITDVSVDTDGSFIIHTANSTTYIPNLYAPLQVKDLFFACKEAMEIDKVVEHSKVTGNYNLSGQMEQMATAITDGFKNLNQGIAQNHQNDVEKIDTKF